jgi:hypothetical protein
MLSLKTLGAIERHTPNRLCLPVVLGGFRVNPLWQLACNTTARVYIRGVSPMRRCRATWAFRIPAKCPGLSYINLGMVSEDATDGDFMVLFAPAA